MLPTQINHLQQRSIDCVCVCEQLHDACSGGDESKAVVAFTQGHAAADDVMQVPSRQQPHVFCLHPDRCGARRAVIHSFGQHRVAMPTWSGCCWSRRQASIFGEILLARRSSNSFIEHTAAVILSDARVQPLIQSFSCGWAERCAFERLAVGCVQCAENF